MNHVDNNVYFSGERLKTFNSPGSQLVRNRESFSEHNDLLKEISDNVDGQVREALKNGDTLMEEIKREKNYPAEYLNNVKEKVHNLNKLLDNINSEKDKLESTMDYVKRKKSYTTRLKELQDKLKAVDEWLDEQWHEDEYEESDLDEVNETLLETTEQKKVFQKHEDQIQEVKQLAREIATHQGAVGDPNSKVKSDLYEFVDKWDSLKTSISRREEKLFQLKKLKLSEGPSLTENEMELEKYLEEPMQVKVKDEMESEIKTIKFLVNCSDVSEKLKEKAGKRLKFLEVELSQIKQFYEELEGLSLWMKEVHAFLHAEEAAFGDLTTLEAQLKESNALQDDIETLRPNVTVLNNTGHHLKGIADKKMALEIGRSIADIKKNWESTVNSSREQNKKLTSCLEQSMAFNEDISVMETFLDHLSEDIPTNKPVTQPNELAQRTYKLLQLKDRVERKKPSYENLISKVDERLRKSDAKVAAASLAENQLEIRVSALKTRWKDITTPIYDRYSQMKLTSAQYGEFKTLMAQESDWLERLEKRLKKSNTSAAADAEEISEKLDDIENFLHNHPEDRLVKLDELAKALSENHVIFASVETDTKLVKSRWSELSKRAKERITLLEGKTN